jgi:hypothetical protein
MKNHVSGIADNSNKRNESRVESTEGGNPKSDNLRGDRLPTGLHSPLQLGQCRNKPNATKLSTAYGEDS